MKKYIIKSKAWILMVALFAVLFSCTEKLDIKPSQSIEANDALVSSDNIKAALVGAYYYARSAGLFGSYFNEYSELYATTGDLKYLGTYKQPGEFAIKEATITNSYVEYTWTEAYTLINLCNTLLDTKTLDILDDADRDLVEGEASFLRGWIYFDMTRFFGLPYEKGETNSQLAVPLVLIPTYEVADAIKVARNTVEACYSQVITDLTTARDLLPETNGVYATTYAASAILARVYLQKGDYVNAATEANNVIENGGFVLTATPLKSFNNATNSTEDIFAFQNNVASNTSWLTVMYASLNGAGRGDYEVQQVFLDRFDALDLRGMLQSDTEESYTIDEINMMYYIGVGTILNAGGINTSKWGNYYRNLPMIRLAEMYLVRAEANFEDAGTDIGPNTPTQDINAVRERAQAPLYLTDVTQDQIREERYLELCWEGHRLHDLKRWKMNIGDYTYDAGNLILPIPYREMEVNDMLVQNSWYVTGK